MLENLSSETDHFQFAFRKAVKKNAKKKYSKNVVSDFVFASSH